MSASNPHPSSHREPLSTAEVLNWARGLEAYERLDFVYLLIHSLFPTELRYLHGVVDGLIKRDEALYAPSIHKANDFVRLSDFYDQYDPHYVISNDGLRRQFIIDLSALHPLNFYCAEIFCGVLHGAQVNTWSFDHNSATILRELILITTMVARHAAFQFSDRLSLWSCARTLTRKLKLIQEAENARMLQQELVLQSESVPPSHFQGAHVFEAEPILTVTGSLVRNDPRNTPHLVNGIVSKESSPVVSVATNATLVPLSPESPSNPPLSKAALVQSQPTHGKELFQRKSSEDAEWSQKERRKTKPDQSAADQKARVRRRAVSAEEDASDSTIVNSSTNKPALVKAPSTNESKTMNGPINDATKKPPPNNVASTRNPPQNSAGPRGPVQMPPQKMQPQFVGNSRPHLDSRQQHLRQLPNMNYDPQQPVGLPAIVSSEGNFPIVYRISGPPNGIINIDPNPKLKWKPCPTCGQPHEKQRDCTKRPKFPTNEAADYCSLKRDAKLINHQGRGPGKPS